MEYVSLIKNLNQKFNEVLNSCPELTYIGNPILRQKTTDVSLSEGLEITKRLKDSLGRYRAIAGFGRGLAAPQIGESKSVFVTYVDDAYKTYINPKITKSSPDSNLFRESCLSCGYLSVDVKRPDALEIEYTDEQGNIRKEYLDSFSARLIQHELDHLEGVINIDKAEEGSIEFMINDPLKERLRP